MKTKKEQLNLVKIKTVNNFVKERAKDMQSSKEASEEIQIIMNKLLNDLVDKSINNAKFRDASRIMTKDVLKAYEEMFMK